MAFFSSPCRGSDFSSVPRSLHSHPLGTLNGLSWLSSLKHSPNPPHHNPLPKGEGASPPIGNKHVAPPFSTTVGRYGRLSLWERVGGRGIGLKNFRTPPPFSSTPSTLFAIFLF